MFTLMKGGMSRLLNQHQLGNSNNSSIVSDSEESSHEEVNLFHANSGTNYIREDKR
jgi:hypothetical protein